MDSRKTKNILISCALILTLACFCMGVLVVSGVGVSWLWPIRFPRQDPSQTRTIIVDNDNQEPDTGLVDEDILDSDFPSELAEVIFQIEAQVRQIRGLDQEEPVNRTLITVEELTEIVAEEFFDDYTDEDARNDVLILSTLGLLPEGFDLKGFYNDLYSEQISGFYDSDTKEIFVVKGMTFGGSEKLTYAHEYTHVLQDQVFDFDEGLDYNEESCNQDAERCAAIRALIEGDATFTEILWFQTYATREDYDDLMDAFTSFESPVLDAAPPYIAADLYFPYDMGYTFVEYLYDQGGFAAVDDAFLNPPRSTKQILSPELYPDHVPQMVTLPDLDVVLDDDWFLYDQNIMGQWYLYLILNKAYDETYHLLEDLAMSATSGWAGDAYAFYLNEETDEVTFVLDIYWDTVVDAETFADAFNQYANLRWSTTDNVILEQPTWKGPQGTVVFTQDGDRTIWVMASNDLLVESILMTIW